LNKFKDLQRADASPSRTVGLTRIEGELMRARLRLFTGFEESRDVMTEPAIKMSFAEFSQVVFDAVRNQRTWLADFADDEVQISEDLYDVLVSYSRMRPGA
jgi:hypothetical protein